MGGSRPAGLPRGSIMNRAGLRARISTAYIPYQGRSLTAHLIIPAQVIHQLIQKNKTNRLTSVFCVCYFRPNLSRDKVPPSRRIQDCALGPGRDTCGSAWAQTEVWVMLRNRRSVVSLSIF